MHYLCRRFMYSIHWTSAEPPAMPFVTTFTKAYPIARYCRAVDGALCCFALEDLREASIRTGVRQRRNPGAHYGILTVVQKYKDLKPIKIYI